jgi:glycosyltransferase involved in cell wall biosynthesis
MACIAEHHVMVLPSLGENFGHAIYEALACSRPVIIGNNTAWPQSDFIGSCDPENVEALTQLIQEAASLDQAAFDHLSIASKQFALSWYTDQNFDKAYLDAFS